LTGFGRVPKLVEHARQRRSVAGDSGSNGDGGHCLQVSTPRGTFSSVAATPLSQAMGRQLVPHLDFIAVHKPGQAEGLHNFGYLVYLVGAKATRIYAL